MLDELYIEYKPLLFSIAYRMLGMVSDAEDIVQEVYLKASEKDLEHIENKKGYLCKMVTNSCLDNLKSSRKQREVYIGPWLPEPLLLQNDDPLDEMMRGEMISFAFLILMEELNPIERAVFILREVMEYNYMQIGEIVGRNEASCRKIFSRVKQKLPLPKEGPEKTIAQDKEMVIASFISAIASGNIEQLESMLAQDVTLYSDGGGKVYAAIKPIQSREFVYSFITTFIKKNTQTGTVYPITQTANINGQTGILTIGVDKIKTIITFNIHQDKIQDIYIIRNPDKLQHISISLSSN